MTSQPTIACLAFAALAAVAAAPNPSLAGHLPARSATVRGDEARSTGCTDVQSNAGLSRADTLARLETIVEIEFAGHPLHDVVRYLALVADVPLEPLWLADREPIGLDPMVPIHLDVSGLSVRQALEAVLAQAGAAQRLESGATWQFSPAGAIEFGPRERLNRPAANRTEVYPVRDLLALLSPPIEAPRLDVAAATQPLRPGSGVWVFPSDTTPPSDPEAAAAREVELVELIIASVETTQWTANGGPAAITLYDGALIVRAPDYIHRALVGPLGVGLRTNTE